MPVWHEALRKARENGDVAFVGVVQEQHPERCQLFAQWKRFDWPILHDPVNVLSLRAVPVLTAIDEHGVVRQTHPNLRTIQTDFLDQSFTPPEETIPSVAAARPNIAELRDKAKAAPTYDTWKALGDALVLWQGGQGADEAIHAYEEAKNVRPDIAEIYFRLGVAYRMRYDRRLSKKAASPDDLESDGFQAAIDHWGRALEIDPNHYIYRRRIQQYGPRLSKPYPFYDWVTRARAEIIESGREPVSLPVEPSGAEIASPLRRFVSEGRDQKSPDPEGRIQRDSEHLIEAHVVVVPSEMKPGQSVRVHLAFEPSRDAHWNNEAEPLVVWVECPKAWEAERQLLASELPEAAETTERRPLEFELQTPADAKGSQTIHGYALYYVCEEEGGTCLYLRKDIDIPIRIAEPAK